MNPPFVQRPESPRGLGSYSGAPDPVGAEPPRRWTRRHVLSLAGLLFTLDSIAQPADASARFPDLALPMLHADLSLATLLEAVQRVQRPGQPVLVYLWATWCPVCESMRAPMNELVRSYAMVTVAVKSGTASDVARVAQAKGLSWPILVDESGQLGRALGFNAVPGFLVLSPNLTVDWTHQGLTDTRRLRARLDAYPHRRSPVGAEPPRRFIA